MREEPESLKTPELDKSKSNESPADQRMERAADDLAKKAGQTEKNYGSKPHNSTFPRGGPSGVS
ncbi:MAG: hypothetical protein WB524_21535 [Acidobacteriaceae bacterium]